MTGSTAGADPTTQSAAASSAQQNSAKALRRIAVVGAVLVRDGLVMAAQRGPDKSLPGMWEFPGGKVEDGETPEQSLRRELLEELHCRARVGQHVTTTEHQYPFGIIILDTYLCTLDGDEPQLTEHTAIRWMAPDDLMTLDWAPADIPAVCQVQELLGRVH